MKKGYLEGFVVMTSQKDLLASNMASGKEMNITNVSDLKISLELLHALSFAHVLWPLCRLYSFTYKDKF